MKPQSGNCPTLTVLGLLARLATMISRPLTLMHPSHFETLGGKKLRQLAAHAKLAPFLEDAACKSLDLHRFELPEDLQERLVTQAGSRAAVRVVASTLDELDRAARFISAAMQHRRLAALVARADRERAAGQLGREPFQLAVREAFAFYGELAPLSPDVPPPLDPPPRPGGYWTAPLAEPGYACLYAFVKRVEPALQPILHLRVPLEFTPLIDASALTSRQQLQILALLRRKMPGWDGCIA